MKKVFYGVSFLLVAVFALNLVLADKPAQCNTIQSGNVLNSYGGALEVGYDSWGYNYQAHMFNGKYCDAYHNDAWCQQWKNDNLMMTWNDAWLSNQDCSDVDSLLDRHLGFNTYIGSGAWLTNHMSGVYDDGGETCHWTYFVKIVAAPADATLLEGIWSVDGTEIGPDIWGQFAIIQEQTADTCLGNTHSHSPLRSGLGNW